MTFSSCDYDSVDISKRISLTQESRNLATTQQVIRSHVRFSPDDICNAFGDLVRLLLLLWSLSLSLSSFPSSRFCRRRREMFTAAKPTFLLRHSARSSPFGGWIRIKGIKLRQVRQTVWWTQLRFTDGRAHRSRNNKSINGAHRDSLFSTTFKSGSKNSK